MRYEGSMEMQTLNFVFPRSDNTSAVSQFGGNFRYNFNPRKVMFDCRCGGQEVMCRI